LFTGFRRVMLYALVAMLAAFTGCGGGGGGGTSDSGTTLPASALPARTLSWEPPTSYIDNSTMNPVTDLDRFEIYVNESGSFTETEIPMAEVSAINKATHTLNSSFNLANIGPPLTVGPHYYVSLRAVALTGLKSDFSPPVSFSF
jgi:hypothetical protein